MVPEVAGSNPVFHPLKKPCSNAGLFLFNTLSVLAYLLSVNQSDWLNLSPSYETYTVLKKSNVSLISFNVSLLLVTKPEKFRSDIGNYSLVPGRGSFIIISVSSLECSYI